MSTTDLAEQPEELCPATPAVALHRGVCAWASFRQPSSSHSTRFPPPCAKQRPDLSRALLVHPRSTQCFPPPWEKHLPLDWAEFTQPGSWQRLPPPCAWHREVLFLANLSHPGSAHCGAPPCDMHLPKRLFMAPLSQPGSWQR
eukprot:CAMPEP_0172634814 /NCGR_PEP_ID=MMETSP1068-20121228/196317_1 /TAXON_ID=35684 /ORGANISM="Pseudopedinella elastica, Strain CCMP716" /LENGTH=142 /DNA_ID=CAMNT_0013446829 /DNA_START=89 /DNA_END=515 /DNA_ORIENTATION=+